MDAQDGSRFEKNIEGVRRLALEAEIAARKRAEDALQRSEDRYALISRGSCDALWEWDLGSGRFDVSSRWGEMLGLEEHQIGRRAEDWMARVHPDDRPRLWRRLEDHFKSEDEHFEVEYRLQHRSGGYRFVVLRGASMRDGCGGVLRVGGSQTDVTERKHVEEQHRHEALHDPLTGLPNRTLFLDRLGQALARLRGRSSADFSVLFIDLDRFKVVNESLGHTAGDRLLVATAHRLTACVRPEDTVARLGGDEFSVLLENAADSAEAARRIQAELSAPIEIDGHEVAVTPSIGIVHGKPDYASAEEILRDADLALYGAKSGGRARHAVFDPAMHASAVAVLRLESELRHAVARGELMLKYQPIVSLMTGGIAGVEALVHWRHPRRGLLRPLEFVPLAEETGLVVPIGEWVLREACRQTREWQLKFQEPFSVGVNLSARQFLTADVVQMVGCALAESGLPARALRLELTESMLMENASRAALVLAELRALGVSLDLDDFGTGYSSLSYLHNFRLDTLKIDRSFIARSGEQGGSWDIVSAIVSLARALRLTLIAEGVENGAQLDELRRLGCEYGQGYLFARPMAAADLEALLARKGTAGFAKGAQVRFDAERDGPGVSAAEGDGDGEAPFARGFEHEPITTH